MATILYYLAHDPISNSEAVLTEYDAELIKRADESGIVFIAVDDRNTFNRPRFRRERAGKPR